MALCSIVGLYEACASLLDLHRVLRTGSPPQFAVMKFRRDPAASGAELQSSRPGYRDFVLTPFILPCIDEPLACFKSPPPPLDTVSHVPCSGSILREVFPPLRGADNGVLAAVTPDFFRFRTFKMSDRHFGLVPFLFGRSGGSDD